MAVLNFFSKIWDGIRSVISLILPGVRAASRMPGSSAQRCVGFSISSSLAAVLVLSFVVNKRTGIGAWGCVQLDLVGGSWFLTLIVVLIYVMSWVAKWLWDLLQPKAQGSDFPDIDDAWVKAIEALREQQIELTDCRRCSWWSAGRPRRATVDAGGSNRRSNSPPARSGPFDLRQSRVDFCRRRSASLISKQSQLAVKEEFEMPVDMAGGGTSTVAPVNSRRWALASAAARRLAAKLWRTDSGGPTHHGPGPRRGGRPNNSPTTNASKSSRKKRDAQRQELVKAGKTVSIAIAAKSITKLLGFAICVR